MAAKYQEHRKPRQKIARPVPSASGLRPARPGTGLPARAGAFLRVIERLHDRQGSSPRLGNRRASGRVRVRAGVERRNGVGLRGTREGRKEGVEERKASEYQLSPDRLKVVACRGWLVHGA